MQLKGAAKLLTVIGLAIKHSACRITSFVFHKQETRFILERIYDLHGRTGTQTVRFYYVTLREHKAASWFDVLYHIVSAYRQELGYFLLLLSVMSN